MLRVTHISHPHYNHFTLADYFRRILAARRLLRYPITPAVIIPFEEANLAVLRRSPSPEPIPIPPRHTEHPVRPESVEPLRSTSPTSYFTAAEYQSQRSPSVASTSVTGTEGALLETETVEVAQVGRDDIEFEEHLVSIIPGWAALQQEIIQGIVDSIHANPCSLTTSSHSSQNKTRSLEQPSKLGEDCTSFAGGSKREKFRD